MATAADVPGSGDPRDSGDGGTIVFRPRLARVGGLAVGSVVLAAMLIAAVVVPQSFSLPDRIGFVALGLGAFWFCWREAAVHVTAGPESVVVRNLFSHQEVEWAEIVAVSFPEGDAWAHLDLADGDTLATMAFQRADGDRGIDGARHLARLVRERGEAPEREG